MNPYYQDEWVTIYHGNCRDVMPQLKQIDAIITDPPYGMNNNTDSSRFSGGSSSSLSRRGLGGRFKNKIIGDTEPFDPTPFINFNHVILFGFNHFANKLPVGTTLVWIKRLDDAFGSFLSDAELAWEKGGCGVYCKRDVSIYGEAKTRLLPNQKPIMVMT